MPAIFLRDISAFGVVTTKVGELSSVMISGPEFVQRNAEKEHWRGPVVISTDPVRMASGAECRVFLANDHVAFLRSKWSRCDGWRRISRIKVEPALRPLILIFCCLAK